MKLSMKTTQHSMSIDNENNIYADVTDEQYNQIFGHSDENSNLEKFECDTWDLFGELE